MHSKFFCVCFQFKSRCGIGPAFSGPAFSVDHFGLQLSFGQ